MTNCLTTHIFFVNQPLVKYCSRSKVIDFFQKLSKNKHLFHTENFPVISFLEVRKLFKNAHVFTEKEHRNSLEHRPVIIDKTEEDFKLKARKVIGRVLFATNCWTVYKLQPSGMCTSETRVNFLVLGRYFGGTVYCGTMYNCKCTQPNSPLALFPPHWREFSLSVITKKVYEW